MTGDECACGICAVETCDVCGGLVAFLDDDGEAWCRSCFSNHEQNLAERWEELERRLWHGGDDWMGDGAYRRAMREAGR
jgi:hypothetical protein